MTVALRQPILRLTWGDADEAIDLAALQGLWTEAQYLKLSDQTNRLIEFTDGEIEVLPMPTPKHQKILAYLYRSLFAIIERIGGIALFAPLRVRMKTGKYREPDIVVLRDANDPRQQESFWLGADLVAEVVSPDDPERDLVTKRADYAEAGIAEYWIVNPLDETITVLTLQGGTYAEHGIFGRGAQADSPLLPDFHVSVDAVFDAR